MIDKKKELSKCCNAPIEKLNDWGAEYIGCSKCFSAQSLDKKKPKELDWEKEWNKLTVKSYNLKTEKYEDEPIIFVNDKSWKKVKNFIQLLLTQQRTGLLEEIKKLKMSKAGYISSMSSVKNHYEAKGWDRAVEAINNNITNFLNKKDE